MSGGLIEFRTRRVLRCDDKGKVEGGLSGAQLTIFLNLQARGVDISKKARWASRVVEANGLNNCKISQAVNVWIP